MEATSPTAASTSPRRFRSVLPHEPLPIFTATDGGSTSSDKNDKEQDATAATAVLQEDRTTTTTATHSSQNNIQHGFVHLQGAFEPKNKTKTKTNHTPSSSYWKSVEELERILLQAFGSSDSDTDKDQDTPSYYAHRLQLPYPALSVTITDTLQYSKVRLEYASPYVAVQIQDAFRYQKLSPDRILTPLLTKRVSSVLPVFGSRPCQATMITELPFVGVPTTTRDNNPKKTKTKTSLATGADKYWLKSTPPQFRRLLHARSPDEHERNATRFVYVTNLLDTTSLSSTPPPAGKRNGIGWWNTNSPHVSAVYDAIRHVFGREIEVFLPRKSNNNNNNNNTTILNSCHLGFRTAQAAQDAVNGFQGKIVTWEYDANPYYHKKNTNTNTTTTTTIKNDDSNNENPRTTLKSGELFLDYTTVTKKSIKKQQKSDYRNGNKVDATTDVGSGDASRPDCTTQTQQVTVPGLVVIEDIVTPEEEELLVAILTGPQAPWAPPQIKKSLTGTVRRKVQHYGYIFDYRTADVIRHHNSNATSKNNHTTTTTTTTTITDNTDDATPSETIHRIPPPLPAIGKKVNRVDENEETKSKEQHMEELVRDGRGWELLAEIIEKLRRYEFDDTNGTVATGTTNSKLNPERQQQQPSMSTTAKKKKTVFSDLNQLTVNQYKPGEGIGSHIDTPSAFGDGLISISLNSGIVMEFTQQQHQQNETTPIATTMMEDNNTTNQKQVQTKKLVYLPRRSLVLMSGPARYEWEHQIVTRRTDTVNGVVLPRGLRISLTLRTALCLPYSNNGNDDDRSNNQETSIPPSLPRYESNIFPPIWSNTNRDDFDDDGNNESSTSTTNSKTNSALITPNTEKEHVHDVYDAIATQWHHTRGKRGVLWPSATQFVQNLSEGSIVADVGCGDGKYFPAVWESGSYVIGTDISLPLLKTTLNSYEETLSVVNNDHDNDDGSSNHNQKKKKMTPENCRLSPHRQSLQKRPAVAVADCMSIPFRDGSCDAAISIAVMHHLSTYDRRVRCIEELVRIVKVHGTIMIQAWAMGCHSRRRFAATDVFVPFNAQPKYLDRIGSLSSKLSSSPPLAIKQPSNPPKSKSVAELYSDAYENADYDERKGLVVFQRYCHMYREGELDEIAEQVSGVKVVESGYESGNYFVILEKID